MINPLKRNLPDDELVEEIKEAYRIAGTWEGAARLLGVSTKTIYNYKKKFNIASSNQEGI